MPISGKEMRKLFSQKGYKVVAGQGKGSHWKLRHIETGRTVIIPNHKELSIGVEKSLKKILKSN